jgi:hypothetical protein
MLGERRGRVELDRANTSEGPRKDRLAIGAVLLAIAVSLAGACVVIVDASAGPPAGIPLTIAAAG